MQRLVLIRYGSHQDGHLTEEGKLAMVKAANNLRPYLTGKSFVVLASTSPRAAESGEIVAKVLGSDLHMSDALYAAEEEGIFPDTAKAATVLQDFNDIDTVVAIASREYIETLPSYLINKTLETNLERGECLIINLEEKVISYLR
jgi:phosphohistidine phosphatase SixA